MSTRQLDRISTRPIPQGGLGTRVAGLLPGIAGMSLLGSAVAVIDGLAGLAAFWVQAVRYAAAAATLLLLGRLLGRPMVLPRGADLIRVLIGAGLGLIGFNLAMILGTAHAEPAVLGAAVCCIPIVLAIGGPLAQGRRPSPMLITGASVVAVGAVLVSGWGRTDALGIVMGLALIGLEAGFTLVVAPALPRIGAWGCSTATCVVAAVVFGVLALITDPHGAAALAEPRAILSALYLGAVATAISFVLWFGCVHRIGAGAAGLTAGAAAPASALVGLLIGIPLPGAVAWLGMAAIVAGLLIGLPKRPAIG